MTLTATAHALLLRAQHAVLTGLTACPHDDGQIAPHWVAAFPHAAMCGKCATVAPHPLRCVVCDRLAPLDRYEIHQGQTTIHADLCATCLLPDLDQVGDAK